MAALTSETTLNDLPDVILSNIIAAISDIRSRNAASLVCHKWRGVERATRTAITLRGNVRNINSLRTLPRNCFNSVTHLDLSLVSPWGEPLFSAVDSGSLLADILHQAFPAVTSLTIYARDPLTIQLLGPIWPHLSHIKLVRWHQRPQLSSGEELRALFQQNNLLTALDLSHFYCWTDDVPTALPESSMLTSLNLLNPSFMEGFKSNEIMAITRSCPNLREFRSACTFDHRYIGFVGDECLVSIPVNCPRLSVVHLADDSVLENLRGNPEFEGFTAEDSRISVVALIEFFSGLPLLEELALDVCNNIRNTGPALEMLKLKCPKLKSLKLGQFHGVSIPIESKLDGIALCQGLESLSLRNVGDLNDMGLIAIGRGCWQLKTFEIRGCKKITMKGMRTLATLLRRTLVDVKISCCKNLNVSMSLRAMEPVQDRIQRLHIDCIWNSVDELEEFDEVHNDFDLNKLNQGEGSSQADAATNFFEEDSDSNGRCSKKKRCRYSYDLNSSAIDLNLNGNCNESSSSTWENLQCLSLWIGVGELLSPLPASGLVNCPNLEEIRIKVEGDSREWSKCPQSSFGLGTLELYPRLSKMHLDCGDIIGYAHTAPLGLVDLSQWERFYLRGIEGLNLSELNYWPPQDRDVNQRTISLPVSGLLQQCLSLRKLFIHGTAHEHFMRSFLNIPNLRDFQLREDYYPAPENEMITELREVSLSRFELQLNQRQIPD